MYHFDIMPTMKEVFMVAGGICLIFIPMSFAEIIAETPVMGSSVISPRLQETLPILSCRHVLTRLKLPTWVGTSEADAISGIAVCVSSLVTMGMIAIGVLLLTPLEPLLTSPVVETAANYVLPALFGYIILTSFGEHVGGGSYPWKTEDDDSACDHRCGAVLLHHTGHL